MEHLLEDKNISLAHDVILPNGQLAEGGSKITILSSQGCFNGYNMRVPPPEFEALMFFNSLDAAVKAEILKKGIKVQKSNFDKIPEVDSSGENMKLFFAMCQQAMAAITFSIGAIESWVNKSFILYGTENGKVSQLKLERPGKPDRIIAADKIASDPSIPIRPKIFQLAPQIFNVQPLKAHSTLRNAVADIVDERNIVMHMQSSLSINNMELDRVGYAVKLYKISALNGPEQVLKYLNYIYQNSAISSPSWLEIANNELKVVRKKLKSL